MKILVVEDDPKISDVLKYALDSSGYAVETAQRGREVALTAQEFKLVELLVRHPGRVFTRQQVLNRAWGDGGLVTDRTIDVHIKSLRKKFADLEFIETVRGVGYRAREL